MNKYSFLIRKKKPPIDLSRNKTKWISVEAESVSEAIEKFDALMESKYKNYQKVGGPMQWPVEVRLE